MKKLIKKAQAGTSLSSVDAISGADYPIESSPITFLTQYVNSNAFKQKAPNIEYVNRAKQNISDFKGVRYKPNKFGIRDFFNNDIINFTGAPYASPRKIIYMPGYNDAIQGNYPDDEGYNNPLKGKRVYNREDVLSHEFGHIIDPMTAKPIYSGSKILEYKDAPDYYLQLLHNHNRNDLNFHDLSDTEKYADLQAFRYLLFKNNIFDARKDQSFESKHLQKAKQLGLRKNSRLMQMFDDNTIIQMMNTIASNTLNNEQNRNNHIFV